MTIHELRKRHVDEIDALILATLQETGWNKAEAARRLGMDRVNLIRIIQRHGLEE